MNIGVKYMLERYRPGGSNRYTCPFCGKKKCFTRYINVETGEYVDETCGKCNHENSCPQVHYPPREFFRDHPEHDRRNAWVPDSFNEKKLVLGNAKRPVSCTPVEFQQKEFFDMAWVEAAAKRQSTFRTWFMGLPFDDAVKQRVLAEYYVGATARDIVVNGENRGPAAVFWLIDEQQRVHDAKLIAYTEDGHRVEGWGNYMRSICEKAKTGPQLQETEKVLFGLHLLNRYPEKTVCIVESEKTALVCACRYPKYIWMATGGCGNLQPRKLRPLMNRQLVVYPDSGEYEKWSKRMKESRHKQYNVVDALEKCKPNTDIADVLLARALY